LIALQEKSNILIIEAGRTERRYWRDLWLYRELFYFFVWRDILVRYKQTVFGVAWALVRPLSGMIVFTVIFSKIAKLPSEGVPYPLLVYVGMLPWQFFSDALSSSSGSLVSNSELISKVYFPRLIIPGSSVLVSFTDFAISSVFLIAMMTWYGIVPGWQILFLPVFIGISAVGALGLGLWFGSLNVKYRDFRYVIPFVIQLGLYISPVGYTSKIVSEEWSESWRLLYSMNPMVGIIDGFRWSLMGGNVELYWPGVVASIVIVTAIFVGGLRYFRKTERSFADVI